MKRLTFVVVLASFVAITSADDKAKSDLENLSYAEALEKYGDKIKNEDRKLLDKVVKKDDRAISLQIKVAKDKPGDSMIVFVSLRDGKAKVVGVWD